MIRRLFQGFAVHAITLCALTTSIAMAAPYPDRAITMLVPFGAGGITDLVARATGRVLSEQLGQAIIVENKPGASGSIAGGILKREKPDGYTLMFTTVGVVSVNPHTQKNVPFDSLKDFTYISTVASTPHVVVVNSAIPVTSLKELIDLAKKKPESLTFGTAGIGSSPFQGMEIMQESTGAKFLHVPFKSGAESVTSVASGQVDMTFEATPVVMPFVHSGKLRALAVASPERVAAEPGLPTTAEVGYPDLVSGSVAGLIGPAGLPPEVVAKLNAATRAALKDPAFQKLLRDQGTTTASSSPTEFRTMVTSEYEKWEKIMNAVSQNKK